jgi:hypothetical protein
MPAIRLFRLRVFTGLCGRKEMKMSELRDRIAATIYHTAAAWDQDWPWESLVDHVKVIYLEQADAVIEALDLRIEDKYKTASGQKQLFGVSGFFEVEVDGD